MRSILLQTLCVFIAVTVLACKNSTSPSGAGNNSGSNSGSSGGTGGGGGSAATCSVPGNPATGSMTAVIDNVAWKAVCLGANTTVTGIISVAGGENTTATTGITLALAMPRSVGINTIGILSPANALLTIGGGSLWQASPAGGSGTLTVTSSTTNSVAGTFSFSMAAQSGTAATGTKTVTSGTFTVNF